MTDRYKQISVINKIDLIIYNCIRISWDVLFNLGVKVTN